MRHTFFVLTTAAGFVNLMPEADGRHVMLDWMDHAACRPTTKQYRERGYATAYLLAEGFVAFSAGMLEPDKGVTELIASI